MAGKEAVKEEAASFWRRAVRRKEEVKGFGGAMDGGQKAASYTL
jgi:hypothetical protein